MTGTKMISNIAQEAASSTNVQCELLTQTVRDDVHASTESQADQGPIEIDGRFALSDHKGGT